MDPLFIDIGNSVIKLCRISNNNGFYSFKYFPYLKNNFKVSFRSLLADILNEETGLKVCIVHSDINQKKDIEKTLIELEVDYVIFDRNSEGILNINYEDSLGIDRYCAVNGAKSKYMNKENILVIDFGTATTFNFISGNNFNGGLIFPGISSSAEMLSERTGLPNVKLKKEYRLIENTTETNISSGILMSNILAINGLIQESIKKFNDLFIIATGGNYDYIKNDLRDINSYEENLKFEGMKVLYLRTKMMK
ncbi:hypothetical protein BH10BAC5_BH10BAC5_07970 [soil metagenome]